jgi:hypothetical protein
MEKITKKNIKNVPNMLNKKSIIAGFINNEPVLLFHEWKRIETEKNLFDMKAKAFFIVLGEYTSVGNSYNHGTVESVLNFWVLEIKEPIFIFNDPFEFGDWLCDVCS